MRIGILLRVVAVGMFALASPLRAQVTADSVRPYLVFAPVGERWFVAANRGKRMLLDIGRVDIAIGRDSAAAAAYREAVRERTTVPEGTSFVLHTPWGLESVRATDVDVWEGRIVLVLAGSPRMDSVAAGSKAMVGAAERVPAPVARLTPASCDRAAPATLLAPRLAILRDSLEAALRAMGPPPSERLGRRLTTSSSHVAGCFARSRALLVVSLRAPAAEWTRERAVLVDSVGRATSVGLEDLRFLVHDLLEAFDADGDGVDDVVAIGRRHRAGGTTILRYDPTRRRFTRLASGFAWEDY